MLSIPSFNRRKRLAGHSFLALRSTITPALSGTFKLAHYNRRYDSGGSVDIAECDARPRDSFSFV